MLGMKKVKVCYKDGKSNKILFGKIDFEDSIFISLTSEDNTCFRINKSAVVFIKEVQK
jgi:hypothetical protein